jgi:ParB family transcriptional regulator, chromosome partitioning protein
VPAKRPSLRERPVLPAVGAAEADDLLMGAERRRQEVQEIPATEIMPNRRQPRTRPSDEGLDELAASIGEHGVLQPILVQAISLRAYEGRPCRYEIIAGERRWRASQRAGKTTIPAIVLGETANDRQLLVLALIENLQREGLPPLDEGMAFAQLQSEFGLTQQEIATRVGKSRGYVQNRIRLTTVPEDLQQLAIERPDTLVHIYEIARVDDVRARADLIAAVRDERISYAETRARVAALLAPPEPPLAPPDGRDLRKSFADPSSSLGRREASAESFGAPTSVGHAGSHEHDLRKSLGTAHDTFLTTAERAVLTAVARRMEGGAAVPEGEDLDLLLRLSMLVAALLPDEQ